MLEHLAGVDHDVSWKKKVILRMGRTVTTLKILALSLALSLAGPSERVLCDLFVLIEKNENVKQR